MSEPLIPYSEIMQLLHENSENDFRHTTYRKESLRFHYLMQGDMRAVDEAVEILNPEIQGTLSLDPVRNIRYLLIVSIGLASRYVIEAGVPQETIYSSSDLHIRRADVATTIEELLKIHKEYWIKAVELVRQAKAQKKYSKPIMGCLNYIDSHFNTRITLSDMAKEMDLHPAYLASLFKKEVGETFASYLTRRRVETAKALLTRTEYSYSQIAYSLSFCSQSHFIKVFREGTGYTPRQYRMQFYNSNFSRNISG